MSYNFTVTEKNLCKKVTLKKTTYRLMQVKRIAEHSAIRPTFIKLPFVIKVFVLPIFERSFHTGLTV